MIRGPDEIQFVQDYSKDLNKAMTRSGKVGCRGWWKDRCRDRWVAPRWLDDSPDSRARRPRLGSSTAWGGWGCVACIAEDRDADGLTPGLARQQGVDQEDQKDRGRPSFALGLSG